MHRPRAAEFLHDQVRTGRFPGLQYVHFTSNSILFRVCAGLAQVAQQRPVSRTTTFNGFSVTKTVTAVAVLQLIERGQLALDAPATAFFPRFPYRGNITIRNLLTHSAGIPNPIPLRWTHLVEEHAAFDRNAFFRTQYAKHSRTTGEPNTRFRYSNLGYQLLGEIIEAVSGVTYEEYVVQNILRPIGVPPRELGFTTDPAHHASGYHRRNSLSYPLLGWLLDRRRMLAVSEGVWQRFQPYVMNGAAYGGLSGTADGFACYVQALLDPGNTILSAQSRQSLFTENVLRNGKPSGMALAWFTGSLNGEPYYDHAGGGGGYYAELRVYPALRRGSVLLTNRTGLKNERILDRVDRAFVEDAEPTVPRR